MQDKGGPIICCTRLDRTHLEPFALPDELYNNSSTTAVVGNRAIFRSKAVEASIQPAIPDRIPQGSLSHTWHFENDFIKDKQTEVSYKWVL